MLTLDIVDFIENLNSQLMQLTRFKILDFKRLFPLRVLNMKLAVVLRETHASEKYQGDLHLLSALWKYCMDYVRITRTPSPFLTLKNQRACTTRES